MTIQISTNSNGVLIQGDGMLLARLPADFDASTVDLKGTCIDADNLSIAANAASYRTSDIEALKHYAALRERYIEQAQLAQAE